MIWTTRPGEILATATLGLLAAAGALAVDDAPGRLLLTGGAVLLLALAARDLRLRPRLAAGPDGVRVRRWSGDLVLPWDRLRVRAREGRRLGLRSVTLELDTAAGPDDEGVLVVLGRRDLGADPSRVARRLGELDPRQS